MPDIAPDAPTHPGNDLELRIGKALWMFPEFWMSLQKMREMDVARISTDTGFIIPHCPRNDKGGNKGRGAQAGFLAPLGMTE